MLYRRLHLHIAKGSSGVFEETTFLDLLKLNNFRGRFFRDPRAKSPGIFLVQSEYAHAAAQAADNMVHKPIIESGYVEPDGYPASTGVRLAQVFAVTGSTAAVFAVARHILR